MKPIEIGGVRFEPGMILWASAYLLHRDPKLYPEPYAFRPERFLGTKPGTYTWIPFGGGRIRCLGASIAIIEMKAVFREVLSTVRAAPGRPAAGGDPEPLRLDPAGERRTPGAPGPRAEGPRRSRGLTRLNHHASGTGLGMPSPVPLARHRAELVVRWDAVDGDVGGRLGGEFGAGPVRVPGFQLEPGPM